MAKSKDYMRKYREKIKQINGSISLFGKDTRAHITHLYTTPDSRDDVIDMALYTGFVEGSFGTDVIGTQSMSAYMLQLQKLEKEYGAIHAIPTKVYAATGNFSAAAGSAGNGNAILLLNPRYMSNAAVLAKNKRKAEASFQSMPTNGRLTSYAGYTVTHEYGHLVQNALYERAISRGVSISEDAFSARARREIVSIAMKRYSSSGIAMSNYGRSNSYEFFAEAFANAHLGAPNAIGLAMRDYLRDNKLK